jgi:hypothetical protein
MNRNAAAIGLREHRKNPEQGRFASTVRTQQHRNFTGWERQFEAAQHRGFAEVFDDFPGFDGRLNYSANQCWRFR